MSKKPEDLTNEAQAGYGGLANPYLATSPSWYAFELGAKLSVNCRDKPTGVRMGRGDSIWSNGVRWKFMHRATGLRFEAAA